MRLTSTSKASTYNSHGFQHLAFSFESSFYTASIVTLYNSMNLQHYSTGGLRRHSANTTAQPRHSSLLVTSSEPTEFVRGQFACDLW